MFGLSNLKQTGVYQEGLNIKVAVIHELPLLSPRLYSYPSMAIVPGESRRIQNRHYTGTHPNHRYWL